MGRQDASQAWTEPAHTTLKLGNGDFWKDRQLKECRRSNGLCYCCGYKYDPTHGCDKQHQAVVHALTVEEHATEL